MDIVEFIKNFPALAILAPIILLWGQIKEILHRVFNLFVVEVDAQNIIGEALSFYLYKNAKSINLGRNAYKGRQAYIKPLKKYAFYAFKKMQSGGLYYLNGNLIFVKGGTGRDKTSDEYYDIRFNVFFIRGTLEPDKLIENAIDEYNRFIEQLQYRFKIITISGLGNKNVLNNGDITAGMESKEHSSHRENFFNKVIKYKIEDIGYGERNVKKIPFVFYKLADEILKDVKHWKESEDWYRERGILWRRGALCHGLRGSGKTAAIRAVAQTLDLPIFHFDLASLSNREFLSEWQNMQSQIPCIALFEDLDVVYNKRKNLIGEDGGGLSFDCLLNAIGGSMPSEGVYTFVTTNHIENLDEALGVPGQNGESTRPGRLDSMFEFYYIDKECRLRIAQKILEGTNLDPTQFVNDEHLMTAAQFVELCSNAAMKCHWDKKDQ